MQAYITFKLLQSRGAKCFAGQKESMEDKFEISNFLQIKHVYSYFSSVSIDYNFQIAVLSASITITLQDDVSSLLF
jgi:hypothetical protein